VTAAARAHPAPAGYKTMMRRVALACLGLLALSCRGRDLADPSRREACVAQARARLERIGRGQYTVLSFRPTYEARVEFLGLMHFEERYYGLGFEAEIDLQDATGLDPYTGESAKLAHPDLPYGPEALERIELIDLLRRVDRKAGQRTVAAIALFDEQLSYRFVTIADAQLPSGARVTRHGL